MLGRLELELGSPSQRSWSLARARHLARPTLPDLLGSAQGRAQLRELLPGAPKAERNSGRACCPWWRTTVAVHGSASATIGRVHDVVFYGYEHDVSVFMIDDEHSDDLNAHEPLRILQKTNTSQKKKKKNTVGIFQKKKYIKTYTH